MEATHRHKGKPGTTVRLLCWTHKRSVEGSDLNLGVHHGDVYYMTVEGERTPQERAYDVQMLGHITASAVRETFEPLPGQEEYHAELIDKVTQINGA